jgi:hypothetical protein
MAYKTLHSDSKYLGSNSMRVPTSGTKYLMYLQSFTIERRVQGRSRRLDAVQIRYSEYPIYFQYVDHSRHLLFVSTLDIVSFAYARLRSAQRINGPLKNNLKTCRLIRANPGGSRRGFTKSICRFQCGSLNDLSQITS